MRPASTSLESGLASMNDLFLCHTGADKCWTRDLGKLLEQQKIGNRFIKVFFDEWDIDYGTNIIAKIRKGSALVVLEQGSNRPIP